MFSLSDMLLFVSLVPSYPIIPFHSLKILPLPLYFWGNLASSKGPTVSRSVAERDIILILMKYVGYTFFYLIKDELGNPIMHNFMFYNAAFLRFLLNETHDSQKNFYFTMFIALHEICGIF